MIYFTLWSSPEAPADAMFFRTQAEAEAQARSWAVEMYEGDTIEIFVLDTETMLIKQLHSISMTSIYDDEEEDLPDDD